MPFNHFRRFPMLGPLLTRLQTERLRALGQALGVPISAKEVLPGAIASLLRDHFEDPRVLEPHLDENDLRKIGESYTFGTREAWLAKHPGQDFARMVRELVFREDENVPPPPVVRKEPTRKPEHADEWPELASPARWRATGNKPDVTAALAKALGAGFEPSELAGTDKLATVVHRPSGIRFVAVPGGRYEQGLGAAEKKMLQPLARKLGEEASLHVKDLAHTAAPAREITLPPFLCADRPLLRSQIGPALPKGSGETTPVHEVMLVDGKAAAAVSATLGARLLTEAEWEYVARGGEARLWLSGEIAPADFVKGFLGGDLHQGDEPFGVYGLAWGTWVDDGWAPSYKDAPGDGSAREPHELPEVVRGGGAPMQWPWQVGGEALLLLTVVRERREKGTAPVLLARDLPPRRGKRA
jgi:hypothetical protein